MEFPQRVAFDVRGYKKLNMNMYDCLNSFVSSAKCDKVLYKELLLKTKYKTPQPTDLIIATDPPKPTESLPAPTDINTITQIVQNDCSCECHTLLVSSVLLGVLIVLLIVNACLILNKKKKNETDCDIELSVASLPPTVKFPPTSVQDPTDKCTKFVNDPANFKPDPGN